MPDPLNVHTDPSKASMAMGSTPSLPDAAQQYPSLRDVPFILKSHFVLVRSIGAGSFGRVFKGILYDQDVAVKQLTVKNFVDQLGELDSEDAHEQADNLNEVLVALEREVSILRNLLHQKIVQFLGVCLDPPCIITEYCAKGSLYDLLARARHKPETAKRLTWKMRMKLALDAGIGMNFLHTIPTPVLHRDLKTPNLLVDEHWNCKVADFNTSRFIDPSCVTSSISANNPRWLAPEVLQGDHHTKASDVYPFGVILWELLTWQTPWEAEGLGDYQIFNCVVNENLRPAIPPTKELPGDPCPFYDEYVGLMTKCWDKDPNNRPTYQDIIATLSKLKQEIQGDKGTVQRPAFRVKTPDPPPSSPKPRSPSPFKPNSPRVQPRQISEDADSPFLSGPKFSPPSPRKEGGDADTSPFPDENIKPPPKKEPDASRNVGKSHPSFGVWSTEISKSVPQTKARMHWKNLKSLLIPEVDKTKSPGLSENWEMLRSVVLPDYAVVGPLSETVIKEEPEKEEEGHESVSGEASALSAAASQPMEGSSLRRKNSKWSIVQDVFLSKAPEEAAENPQWTLLKDILFPGSEQDAGSEAKASEPTSSLQPLPESSAVETVTTQKSKAKAKWGVLRHILFEDDVPRNPGWDLVHEILMSAPSTSMSEIGENTKEETTEPPTSKAGKRWAKLKDVFVSDDVTDPSAQPSNPLHPGWRIVKEVLGQEADSAAPSANASGPSSAGSALESNSSDPVISIPEFADAASRDLNRLPSKAVRYWSFVRHMISNDERSLLVRHWDFLDSVLGERKESSQPAACTKEGEETKRKLTSPASKRWKKVRDLLIVDYDPPSPEKWNFLREWLIRDDELGKDWEELRVFARKRESVPEGDDWDLFRTLFFEDRGVRSHPHWAFLKDLLVKDATTSVMTDQEETPAAMVSPSTIRNFVLETPEPPSRSRWSMVRTLFMDNNAKPENARETILDLDADQPPPKSKWDEIRDLLSSH